MSDVTIASFNVKNLIGPEQEYYEFQKYTAEEYAWKRDWLADQVLTLDADVIGFQEVFEPDALEDVMEEADQRARALNDVAQPARGVGYGRKAIFRRLKLEGYANAAVAFAPNLNDGEPGQRRPGLAVVSRFGFVGEPNVIQDIDPPLEVPFSALGGETGAGSFTLKRLSRPILKVRIAMGGRVVTLFNCHLKSKLGEYDRPPGADFAPAADLTDYDPVGRALGSLRAGLRRMGEAFVLRRLIVAELTAGNPVIVLGDFNDHENAVSSEIIAGEIPFKNYAWMLRHDAQHAGDRYSREEARQIREDVEAMRLHSAESLFVQKSLRDMVYTATFGGKFESIDRIYLSRHFLPGTPDTVGEMTYFSVLNDHLTDGSHPEAPYNKLASDHGQIMAHLRLRDGAA
ncbi:MAG: alpha-1,4 polygalactosaminidase [Nioella sp.]|nr:alpha-1,4 polygalactosaminidase [Nioella sp.]